MAKITWKPGTMLYPVPAVMVSCGNINKPNIITIAWTGIINSNPPLIYISVRKERHSHAIISEQKKYVINLVTKKLCKAADYCGVKSGKDIDKFKMMNLTCEPSPVLGIPQIKESPLNMECTVKDIVELGSHDMFISEIEAINVDETLINQKGKLRLDTAELVAYSHGIYYELGKKLGTFGFSVKKS